MHGSDFGFFQSAADGDRSDLDDVFGVRQFSAEFMSLLRRIDPGCAAADYDQIEVHLPATMSTLSFPTRSRSS
jgi:hypothetical protein